MSRTGIYQAGTEVMGGWRIVRELGIGADYQVYEAERAVDGTTARAMITVVSMPTSSYEFSALRAEGMDEDAIASACEAMAERLLTNVLRLSSAHDHVLGCQDCEVLPHSSDPGCDVLIRSDPHESLIARMAEGPLSVQEIVRLGVETADALAFCHGSHLAHLSLRPECIFVDATGHYKVGGFCVSQASDGIASGMSCRCISPYTAPELATGKRSGAAADIYSLGVLLYQLLNANRLPFYPPAPAPITRKERNEALRCRMAGEGLPAIANCYPDLMGFVARACVLDPAFRPTAMELRDGLRAVARGEHPAPATSATGGAYPGVAAGAMTAQGGGGSLASEDSAWRLNSLGSMPSASAGQANGQTGGAATGGWPSYNAPRSGTEQYMGGMPASGAMPASGGAPAPQPAPAASGVQVSSGATNTASSSARGRKAKSRISNAIIAPVPKQIFTGAPCKPALVVDCLGRRLVEGVDYEVQYFNNVPTGIAVAKIIGKGDFKGSKMTTFEIIPIQR